MRVLMVSSESTSLGRWIDFSKDEETVRDKLNDLKVESLAEYGVTKLVPDGSDSDIPYNWLRDLDEEDLISLGQAKFDTEQIGAYIAARILTNHKEAMRVVKEGRYKFYGTHRAEVGRRYAPDVVKFLEEKGLSEFFNFDYYGGKIVNDLDLISTYYGYYKIEGVAVC